MECKEVALGSGSAEILSRVGDADSGLLGEAPNDLLRQNRSALRMKRASLIIGPSEKGRYDVHIGLIGGIGPAATVSYYRTLTQLHENANRPLALTIAHTELRELIANLETDNAAAQASIFADLVNQLRCAGCSEVAIAAIGAHFCIKELEAISSLPVISAISAINAFFVDKPYKRIAVLGTRRVMETKVFGISTVEVVVPSPDDLTKVHACYVKMSLAGTATTEQIQYLHELCRTLVSEDGVDAILLGGADLLLAFDQPCCDFSVIEASAIHVEAIARRSLIRG